MKIEQKLIKDMPLFKGIEENELSAMLDCLSATEKGFKKGESIYRLGDSTASVGAVLSGSVHVIKEDFWGNRSILSQIGPGQLFGETYALIPDAPMEVSVVAAENCRLMFLDVGKIMTGCFSGCEFHARLMKNLLAVTAGKNLMLTRKLENMAQRSTREKLLSYLSAQSQRQHLAAFEIPFNRQQLADYLSVDRSAMSKELCRLRDEGVLRFEKNRFELLERQRDDNIR